MSKAKINKKYKNLILYILERANDVNLGKKKLFKLLYFIDFDYYEKHQKSLTGETYVVQQFGPIPASAEMVLKTMVSKKWIEPVKTKRFGYEQHRFIPQEKADPSVFNGDELGHIDSIIKRFEHYDGMLIEAKAKSDIPYQATKASGEKVVDYELVFYRSPSSAVLEDEKEADILGSKPLNNYMEKLSRS